MFLPQNVSEEMISSISCCPFLYFIQNVLTQPFSNTFLINVFAIPLATDLLPMLTKLCTGGARLAPQDEIF